MKANQNSKSTTKLKFHITAVTFIVKMIVSIVFFSSIALIYSSCDKSVPEPLNARRYGGTLSFNFNGEIVSLSENNIYVIEDQLELTSQFQKNRVAGFNIGGGISQKNYEIYNTDNVYEEFPDSLIYTGNFYYVSNSEHYATRDYYAKLAKVGEVIITNIDEQAKTMSGTFSALVHYEKSYATVSNGVFTDVPYQVQDSGTGGLSIAKIDGKEFKGRPAWTTGEIGYGGEHLKIISIHNIPTVTEKSYDLSELVELAADKRYPFSITYHNGIRSYRSVSGTVTFSNVDDSQYRQQVEGTYSVVLESYPLPGEFVTITDGIFSNKR